jgi:hypothetical protein
MFQFKMSFGIGSILQEQRHTLKGNHKQHHSDSRKDKTLKVWWLSQKICNVGLITSMKSLKSSGKVPLRPLQVRTNIFVFYIERDLQV